VTFITEGRVAKVKLIIRVTLAAWRKR